MTNEQYIANIDAIGELIIASGRADLVETLLQLNSEAASCRALIAEFRATSAHRNQA